MRGRVWIERALLSRVRLPERYCVFVEDVHLGDLPEGCAGAGLGQVLAVIFSDDARVSILDRVGALRLAMPQAMLWLVSLPRLPVRAASLPALARAGLDDWYPISEHGEEDRLANDICRLAVLASALPSTAASIADSRQDAPRVGGLIGYCSRNADRRLTAEGVAAWFGEHRRSIDRWLLSATGRTASQWLRSERHRLAKRLRENGHSLEAVAECLGYASASGPQMLLARNTGSTDEPGYDLSQPVVAPRDGQDHHARRAALANPAEESL